jgi:hypothetical protein
MSNLKEMNEQRQTAGETALRQAQGPPNNNYPKRARLFSPDGHASNDIITIVSDEYVERFVRNHARRIGWKCSVRAIKPKAAEPTCDNCASMVVRQTRDGANHRWCELHGQWIPDEENAPTCGLHQAIRKFENRYSKKGGER